MGNQLKRWLLHPWLSVRVEFALGLLFIVAAVPKLMDPPAFAKAIWYYNLFPAWSIHPFALTLPWLELLSGVALCLGLWTRAAAAWIATLLLSFIVALSINLARNHPVDCGCFGVGSTAKTDTERLNDMKWDILRDIGMLILAAHVLAAPKRKEQSE
jgi:uncharacterized membrane protein YphA (DoxX/SURF4 family)